jgi:hypothetical protein
MVQTPQISPKQSAEPLPSSAAKAAKKQTGDDSFFQSLLDVASADGAAAHPASSGAVTEQPRLTARLPHRSAGEEQGAAPNQEDSASQGGAVSARKTNSNQQYGDLNSRAEVQLALLPQSAQADGAAGVGQAPAPSGSTNGKPVAANVKASKDDAAPDEATAAIAASVNANAAIALLAVQLQTAAALPASTNTQAPANATGATSKPTAQAPAPETLSALASQASADAIPNMPSQQQPPALAPAGVRVDAAPADVQSPSLPTALVTETIASAVAQSQAAPAQKVAAPYAPRLTVTDSRTYLAPEKLVIKSQPAGSSTAENKSPVTLSASLEAALNMNPQAPQPVKAVAGNNARQDGAAGQSAVSQTAPKEAAHVAEASVAQPALMPGLPATASPTEQVFNAIESALPAGGGSASASQAANQTAAATLEPVKTITIALQPDGLGAVSIQLSLKSSQLGIRLEASETGTAQILRQSSSDLSGLLQSAGYAVGSIAIHAAPQTGQGDLQQQQGQGGGQNSAFNPSGSNPGGSASGGGGAGAGGQAQQQTVSQNGQQEGRDGRTETVDSDHSLYV